MVMDYFRLVVIIKLIPSFVNLASYFALVFLAFIVAYQFNWQINFYSSFGSATAYLVAFTFRIIIDSSFVATFRSKFGAR